MHKNIFKEGVHSLLQVEWSLMLVTPLCIRNGRQFVWDASGTKSRFQNVLYQWNKTPQRSDHQIQDLHFEVEVNDTTINSVYCVPASSVRGTLRSWTIQHFLQRNDWHVGAFDTEDENSVARLKELVEQSHNGFELITDLFGVALNNDTDGLDISHASRLCFDTQPFSGGAAAPRIFGNFDTEKNVYGPKNAKIQIKERGPVDRITHAAQSGGLHSFVEFSPGQSFITTISIKNPTQEHVALLELWKREMNEGNIRFGAVTNIGRGHLKVHNDVVYSLFGDNRIGFELGESLAKDSNDIMSDVWSGYTVTPPDLRDTLNDYLPKEN
jgi:CRISPR/Cas system CSM-associated protein Csm3 (group 7 of RAMP superfamily)